MRGWKLLNLQPGRACRRPARGLPNALVTRMRSGPAAPSWSIRPSIPRIGGMQYRESLPLEDHEVVLTFDDGPLPPYSTRVLDILAVGMRQGDLLLGRHDGAQLSRLVRRIHEAGHTIGTHSERHPLTFHKMPVERAAQEINDGIASVTSALGDGTTPAPFFRIPGLLRADGVEALPCLAASDDVEYRFSGG